MRILLKYSLNKTYNTIFMATSQRYDWSDFMKGFGKYLVLFYFLNGGVLTIVSPVMKKLSFLDPNLYLNQFLVAVISTAAMFPIVWFINKYLPIITGNKDSFNRLSNTLRINIKW